MNPLVQIAASATFVSKLKHEDITILRRVVYDYNHSAASIASNKVRLCALE